MRLDDGTAMDAAAVVVATEGPAAARLVPGSSTGEGRGVTCLYFAADRAPTTRSALHLDATGSGPVNNLHVATAISPALAPPGRHLISATVLGLHEDPDALDTRVRAQLQGWFGDQVQTWTGLRQYGIRHALPAQAVGALEPARRPVRHGSGVYVCGDHVDQASIDGAMVSGRRAAEAVLADRSAAATG